VDIDIIDTADLKAKVKEIVRLVENETIQVVFDFGYLTIEDGIGECDIAYVEILNELCFRIKRYEEEEETMQPSYKNSTINIKIKSIQSIDIHSEEFKDGFKQSIDIHSEEFKDGFKCIATIYFINSDHDITFYLVGDTIKDQEKRPNEFYEMYKEDIIEFHNSKNIIIRER